MILASYALTLSPPPPINLLHHGIAGNSRAEIEASIVQETADPAALASYLSWFTGAMGGSKEAQDFIVKLMTVDVKKRMTAEGARNHPWMKVGQTATR